MDRRGEPKSSVEGARLRIADELRDRGRPARARARSADDLHVCPRCERDLVLPCDWAPAPPDRWWVALRCPECEWRGEGVYAQQVVDRFDAVLDAGMRSLLEDLRLIARANREEEIERFAAALRAELILPEDF
jgi:hypothetical protein